MATPSLPAKHSLEPRHPGGIVAPIHEQIRAEARRLLELGYTPLPADPIGKKPLCTWKQFQSTPPKHDELDHLFDQHPSATGLGIVTTGMVVLDLDAMPDGSPNPFPADPDQRMALAYVPSVETPRGGLHLYFKAPAGVTILNSASKIADHVDIRAAGGFLMVPPTVRGDRSYEWRGGFVLDVPPDHLPGVPQFILDLLTATAPAERNGPVPLEGPIVEGERNDTLFRLASRWRGQGLDQGQILALLRHENAARCRPPLEDTELETIAESAGKYAPNEPRELPRAEFYPEECPAYLPGDPGPIVQESSAFRPRFISMTDLANRPPQSWLFTDLIPDFGVGFLIGKPGEGKSFALHELIQSVSRQVPAFGDEKLMPTRAGWCLALLPEASASWASRIRAYCDFHGVEYCDDFVCCLEQNDLADAAAWVLLHAAILELCRQRGRPPVLLIVDTLSASIPGHDENSQSEMTLLTAHLRALADMGTCVIVAHHTAKYSDSYRGSSVLLGACDWMVSIVQSGHVREFRAVKLRDAERIASKTFEIKAHGESAVCVGLNVSGPWEQFAAVARAHPGLHQALLHHGFQVAGEQRTPPTEDDICGAGVSLNTIQSTWNSLDAISPTNAEDPAAYKSVHGVRATALLALADTLCRAGVLEVTMGELSRKSRKLSVVVRQVCGDDDD
ncbi:MAG: bifunctional DNA primase/polymerase [Betaproteobacteria bacterium]|nr:bifunctional DNA primase/polymerase [Betaproteobacteria bacterium]